jgi:hypothetical protein
MELKTIFERDVGRPIEGVIKADDEASLKNELEEYVLTNEVAKRLDLFLDAYNNYHGANGVWVSGFFGSGKSHLLKMLALVLENRAVDGATALELFRPKVQGDKLLAAALEKAVAIPSKSILFNIDQKADVISKSQSDALLAVFVKVFDEACGYYGKQPYIAQFERELARDGLFDAFKAEFEQASSHNWEWGRARPARVASFIDQAFSKVTGQKVADVLDKSRHDYRLSIEDFANHVQEWLSKQPATFRLNFFVDEVGQYVAENTKLMTNLQTVAESLATKCNGRAWVIVTAQEDMNAVIGEMSKQQSNDFTKIQARFASRMKLTSADVAEVIQKRLLEKNAQGVQQLSTVYGQQSNNFKTLFDFADGAQTYRNFRDAEHFVSAYPFIPYQFDLFQTAIQGISQHNGFEGKHSSVGERSMLGVFREVAIAIANQPVGQLATFDLMFEGIRTSLKAAIQSAIQQAERGLGDDFSVRLLKALFLVKYVKGFKATLRNLSVLMLDRFDQDIPTLRKKIEAALNLLEQQTYIQRNGEVYEYLSDEEKDIEEEIKNTDVETADVAAELEKLVFDHIIKQRKIRYADNGQDYPFSRKMDDRLQGRESELAIHVITPFNESAGNETTQRMQSMGRDELRVVLPEDERLVRDLLMYKRTEKYIKQNVSVSQQENIKRILNDKGFQNRERLAEIENRLKLLMGKAKLIINAGDLDIASEDAQSRVMQGFHRLIEYSYPNLRMLRGVAFSENDIGNYLRNSQEGLLGNDATNLSESEQELLAHIQSNARGGVRTTIKGLLERFERKPYGWYYAAILCNLALLCARGKVEVRSDSNILEDDALERALRNTHGYGSVVLEPQVEFTASQVRALKDFYSEFFDGPAKANEAKALAQDTAAAFKAMQQELAELHAQAALFPFLNALAPVLATLKEAAARNPNWFLTELPRQEDALHDLKEQLIDPLRKFMHGPQKAIYEEASHFVQEQEDNFAYVQGDEAAHLKAVLTDPNGYKGNRLQQAKSQLDALQQKIIDQRNREIDAARNAIDALEIRLRGMSEFVALPADKQAQLIEPFGKVVQGLSGQKRIAMIRDQRRRFEDQDYPQIVARLENWSRPAAPPPTVTTAMPAGTTNPPPVTIPPAQPQIVTARSITVSFDKAWLADEADLNRYLDALRQAWLKEISAGKRVQI